MIFVVGVYRLFLQTPLVTVKPGIKEMVKAGRTKTKIWGGALVTFV